MTAFRTRVRVARLKRGGCELRVLHTPKPQPFVNQGAIAMVEGLLDRLRSGETTDIGIVEARSDGSSTSGYSVARGYSRVVTGTESLAFRLQNEFK